MLVVGARAPLAERRSMMTKIIPHLLPTTSEERSPPSWGLSLAGRLPCLFLASQSRSRSLGPCCMTAISTTATEFADPQDWARDIVASARPPAI